jgi:peptidoglycan/LPS O-acetylase OafA/YrhL
LAILLVFAYHLPLGAFRAGSYGVTIFFVLSGFLITTILCREADAVGRISFRRFYERRARRLLPALLGAVLGSLAIWTFVFDAGNRWWPIAWPVLGYVSNYASIAGRDMSHLTHTWSLAVEEHFYLLWPLLVAAIPARFRWRSAVGATLILAGWRLTLALGAHSDERVIFGTDTNAFALLLGATVAIGRLENRIRPMTRQVTAIAVATLVGLANVRVHYTDPSFRWGVLPIAGLAAIAVVGATSQSIPWLELRPLRWLGRISYGLYLWHGILIWLPWENLPLRPIFWQVAVPLTIAALSWYLLESRWLRRPDMPPTRPQTMAEITPAL